VTEIISEPTEQEKQRQAKIEQRNRDQIIFQAALTIGCDVLEATGQLPTPDQLETLYSNGYFDYQPAEVAPLFFDWSDYQNFIRQAHEDQLAEKDHRRAEMLEIIELDRQLGVVPEILFKATFKGKSQDQMAREAKRRSDGKEARTKWNLRLPINVEVGDTEKITRYCKYKIAELLTANLTDSDTANPNRDDVDAVIRRVSIAVGYNVASNKTLSSYTAELQKCNESYSIEQYK